MGTTGPLQFAAECLFADIAAGKTPQQLLSHFSTTDTIVLKHDCIYDPSAFAFEGVHAVRSYFDLLALHWKKDDMQIHSTRVDLENSCVVMRASVRWTWKISGNSWLEEFTCTLGFDDEAKVKKFIVETDVPRSSCVMHAVDCPQKSPF
ncbi:hypothetical protein FIBSPDRAFT_744702 [Athelia psychrophila]|uniref:SnoaL-like domain-containing protein n=1 Tax=Athelia psychrophila TaxID=1759441 RepID=A0A166HJR3_9AGAM|nr:hypothetical protein FIBSPDRAFT_744702 [Fibularhizoctonia sp. CBS 109695]